MPMIKRDFINFFLAQQTNGKVHGGGERKPIET
jgi:hypothetical protein